MNSFVDEYLKWLKENIVEKKLENCIEITTPFLDRHNDWIQIFVEQLENGRLYLTDDGYILNDLKNCGIDIKTESRKKLLSGIANGFGVSVSESNELFVTTDKSMFPQKKHMLIQCMMSVSDLYLTSKSNAISVFSEDVKNFFESNDVLYTPNVLLTGKSGFQNKFDFVLPHNKRKPEILIKSISTPTSDNIKLALFQWEDTRERRDTDSKLILYLNDNKSFSNSIFSSCEAYGIQAFSWKDRNNSLSVVAS